MKAKGKVTLLVRTNGDGLYKIPLSTITPAKELSELDSTCNKTESFILLTGVSLIPTDGS
jgi:hypothetical protein